MKSKEWKLIGHSYQIADTGDYDGKWEITDGKTSLFTSDNTDEEEMQELVNMLNSVQCNFWTNFEDEIEFIKSQQAVAELTPPLPASVEDAAEQYSRNVTVGQGEKARQSAKMDFIAGVKFRDRNVPNDEEIEEYVYSKNRANDITFNQAINHHIRKAAYWMRDRIVKGNE